MRYVIIALLFLSVQHLSSGQKHEHKKNIEEAKKIYLQQQLALNETQAVAFWPLYGEYEQKKRKIRKSIRKLHFHEKDSLPDSQIIENFNQTMVYKQEELDLENEYFQHFLKVLSPSQVRKLYNAERTFMKKLYKRISSSEDHGRSRPH
jgi:hypothetical protein